MERAFAYVDAHFDQMLMELQQLCRKPSIAGDDAALTETRRQLWEKLLSLDLAPREYGEGTPLLYGRRDERGKPTVLFYNHYDVVAAGPLKDWATAPFEPQIRADALCGRGVSDNKGALMARLQAVEAILKTGGALPTGAAFLLDGEEETGSAALRGLAEKAPALLYGLADADLCIWENGRRLPDGSAEAAFGVRSTLVVDLSVQTSNGDEHGRMGAELPNAAWRLVWALASLKDAEERVLIDGFYDRVAAVTDVDRAVLAKYPYDEEGLLARKEISRLVLGLRGQALREKIFMEPSVTVSSLEAGEPWKGRRNIVPHSASARISFILVPDQTAEEVLEKLRRHLREKGFEDIRVTARPDGFPVRTPVDHPCRVALDWAARAVYGKPLTPSVTQLGSGPAYLLRTVRPDLPIVCACGVAALDSGHHSSREHIWLENYRLGIKHTIATLYALGGMR